MNIKEKKDQVINWVNENKVNVMLGIGGLITIVVLAINIKKPDTKADIEKEFYIEPENDYGRDLDMQFVDPKTGEILGSQGCCESFMNDMLGN